MSANHDTRGPGEGSWAVFAEKVVVERDELREQLSTLKKKLAEERDCGQPGCCAIAPGCQRCWAIRNGELVTECDEAREQLSKSTDREKRLLQQIDSTNESLATLRAILGYEALPLVEASRRVVEERYVLRKRLSEADAELGQARVKAEQERDEARERLRLAIVDRDHFEHVKARNDALRAQLATERESVEPIVAERDALRAEVAELRRRDGRSIEILQAAINQREVSEANSRLEIARLNRFCTLLSISDHYDPACDCSSCSATREIQAGKPARKIRDV